MTEEKIIKLCEKYINNKDGFMATSFAHKLLGIIEQEKKGVAKKIFNRVFSDDRAGDLGEFCGYGWIYDIDEAKAIAEEYGVEL